MENHTQEIECWMRHIQNALRAVYDDVVPISPLFFEESVCENENLWSAIGGIDCVVLKRVFQYVP